VLPGASVTIAFFQSGLCLMRLPHSVRLALHVHDVHIDDLDVETFFDGLLDLRLVSLAAHLEHVLALAAEASGLLRNHRPQDDVQRMQLCGHGPAEPSSSR